MALLGLDLGEKRVGLAISRSGIIAEPYKLINFNNKFYSTLKKICRQEGIKKIIIGLPKSLKGGENKQETKVKLEGDKISKKIGLPVIFVDERFTSKIAESRFGKERTDEESAVIILETYLDQIKK